MSQSAERTDSDSSSRPRGAWVPWFVMAVSMVAAIAATVYVHRTTRAREEVRFARASQAIADEIEGRIANYVTMLRGVAGLVAAEPKLTQARFRKYVTRLNIEQNYPGTQGIGLTLRVTPDEAPALIERMHAQGVLSLSHGEQVPFVIWPARPVEGHLDAIVYLEPLDPRNQAAIGYNMFSEPVRREAMTRARDSGNATASGRVTLVQEIDERKQAGFLIYVPLYNGDGIPATIAERRKSLIGYAYSPLRVDDLLAGTFMDDENPQVDFAVFDGAWMDQSTLLHQSESLWGPAEPGYEPSFTRQIQVSVAGRDWLIVFRTRPAFDAGSGERPLPLAPALGAMISLVLFWTTRAEVRARAAAERTAIENARLYESARQARAEAERLNRLKDEFLATVSHELRTPLNAILGWAHLLRRTPGDPKTLEQGIETIERNARAQAQLVEDLLDVSRIINGKLRLDVQRISLAPVIKAAMDTVRPAAEAREIRLEAHLDDSAGMVLGDANRLQQVVWNLLSNSIKFTPPGGRVAVSLAREGTGVRVTVSDTGQGMAREFLPHLFTPFRQADASTTRQHGGLGLGLAIVRHMVELHGGSVSADSPGPGGGSTFRVFLPVKAIAAEGPAGQGVDALLAGQQAPPHAHVNLEGLHILVVDDDPDAREMLQRVLVSASARVRTAGSVHEALLHIQEFRPHLLLSDIGLPGDDGCALLHRVRALSPADGGRIPAIALTAFAREEDRRRALDAGFQLHLAKPVQATELLAAIATLTGNVPHT